MWRKELRAIKKLDVLEGDIVKEAVFNNAVFDVIGLEEIETQVHGTLGRHLQAWEEAGACKFVMNVIKEGFRLNIKEVPGFYEEKNNQSFEREKVFGVEAIKKLVKMKVLKEVSKEEVSCVNPLTVAINDQGKKRLCIDLSRYVNEFTEAKKFKIESTMQFLLVVQPGDYMFCSTLRLLIIRCPCLRSIGGFWACLR